MLLSRVVTVLWFIVAAYGLSGRATAQDNKQKTALERFEPRSQPGSGQKFLDKFIGEWDVVKTFYPQSGAPVKMEGRCSQTMVQSGRFLQSVFTFRIGGNATTGMGLIGYEPETGLFTSVWIDSRQTRMSLRQSKDKFSGERIVLYSKSLGQDQKGTRLSRTETWLEDAGRTIVHRQYNLFQTPGSSERLVMELIMNRKGTSR
jgi:Protein of unknown function (DUF1579)